MKFLSIKSCRSIGVKETLDFEVDHKDHNFYAEGLLVSNSHSASYATISAITTYLKFKYPQQFFLSLLRMTKNEPDPIEEISKISKELRSFGIELKNPHISLSNMDFSIEGKDIRFGISSIKGISEKTIEKLLKFKKTYSSKFDIFKASEEAGLSISVLCALIQAGAFGDFEHSRPKIVLEAQLWNILSEKEKKYCSLVETECVSDLIKAIKLISNKIDEKGKPVIKPSRIQTIYKKFKDYQLIYSANKNHQTFANWFYERKLMGFSPSGDLKSVFDYAQDYKYIGEINGMDEGDFIELIGVVKECYSSKSAKGTKYHKMIVGDETGSITCMIFDTRGKMDDIKLRNGGNLPKEESIVTIRGTKKTDAIFVDTCVIETSKIYTKLGEIAKKEEKKLEMPAEQQ